MARSSADMVSSTCARSVEAASALAEHLDIAADRNGEETRPSEVPRRSHQPNNSGPKPTEEDLDPDAVPARHQVMAELMDAKTSTVKHDEKRQHIVP